MDDFFDWFQANGGTVDRRVLGITEFPGSGRGAVALSDIPADHTLFTLPRSLTLSTRTSPLPLLFGIDKWRAHKLHKNWVGLILCMMWEDARAHEDVPCIPGAAKWSPYMRTLPMTFHTPMFWSEDDLQELKGTAVVDKIGREDAERAYHETLLPAVESAPSLFPPSHLSPWYTLDAYHRAGSRILSRSFTISKWTNDDDPDEQNLGGGDVNDHESEREPEGPISDDMDNRANTSLGSAMDVDEPVTGSEGNLHLDDHDDTDDDEDDPSDVAMVPMADLLNARWRSENAKLFYEPHMLRMATTKPVKRGEQIFNTYGDLPNSNLLRRYGYVDLVPLNVDTEKRAASTPVGNLSPEVEVTVNVLGNPSDVVEIKADLVVDVACLQWATKEQGEKDTTDRIEWWLDEGGDDSFVLSYQGCFNSCSSAPYQFPRELTAFIALLLPSADFAAIRTKGKPPKGKHSDPKVLSVLAEVLKRKEGMYAGGSDDEQLLTSASLTTNKRHAIIVRLGEKRILRAARESAVNILHALLDQARIEDPAKTSDNPKGRKKESGKDRPSRKRDCAGPSTGSGRSQKRARQ
ncbi:SET domain-containing protein [Pisolithus orientalis]|uniref:SET domain-containing protein n=1 Tax=Pisolithus orientalis TaxID=936130 RepID=UPI002225653C|nr:SET domain-containing protein [Pisolithus orientalis]KAI6001651.1 SET domain-containing protein [Pisolithus orientalis]